MNSNIKKILKETNYVNKEIKVDESKSSYVRWENKKIKQKINIFQPSEKSMCNIIAPKEGQLLLNKDVKFEDKESAEIRVQKIIKNGFSRSTCGITINFDKINITQFNRVSLWINIKATGYQNFYFHFMLGNSGITHTASVEINKWQRIMWELDIKEEIEVDQIKVTPFLFGCPPEGLTDISFYINKIDLEEVELDHCLGWDIKENIAYSHCGYFVNYEKTAIVQNIKDNIFYLLNNENNVVYTNNVLEINNNLGKFYVLDFSKYNKKGQYKLKVDNILSETFEINENPYLMSIIKSLNFLRLLRCGEDIDGVHSACHLNCKTIDDKGNTVPNFGGWHDAGDLSQFEIPTAEMANALLDLYLNIKDEAIKERILAEAKVGISWLLRTRFSDGSRALAVSYSIWRNNELEPIDNTVTISKAEKGPFESFCSASALAVAARCFEDPIYSDWCLRIAKEDFEYARKWYKEGIYTKRWGKNVDSQVCGHGLIAASELYLITKDQHYLDVAIEYANVVMSCQETKYLDNSNIRGFFYEDPNHNYLLTYEHRGHEQSPIHGLCRLLQVCPDISIKSKVIKSIKLYREYIVNTIHYTYPYNLLPGHIYNIDKINFERFTIPSYMCTKEEGIEQLKQQVKKGIKINNDWYLRIMPIAVQRRGFHATLLSKTKAISIMANVLKDKSLKQLAVNQLEWVLGKNPFASSTMYGEGNNYHPLYVAFSRQMVGSLPVGIQTLGDDDLPYWPTYNDAVFKEIWGHTTGKYLWVLSDIIK